MAFILELNPPHIFSSNFTYGKQPANMISALSTPQPTPQPVSQPTLAPVSSPIPTCSDRTDGFELEKSGYKENLPWRCKNVIGAKEACPKTCTNCCTDNPGTFTLRSNGKDKRCAWAAINTEERCNLTRHNCAVTCGECS